MGPGFVNPIEDGDRRRQKLASLFLDPKSLRNGQRPFNLGARLASLAPILQSLASQTIGFDILARWIERDV